MPDPGLFTGLFTDGHAAVSSFTSWLLTYALHSTVLLTVAWAGSRWLARRRPALEEALWKVALMGGLLTASLQLASGLEPLLGQWTIPGAAVDVAAGTLPMPVGSTPLPAAGAVAAPASTGVSSGLSWTAWMVIAWTVAALGFLASLGVSWRRLRGRLADRREITGGPLPAMLAELRRSAGYHRPVRLSSSKRLAVPIAIGVIRPEICLPEQSVTGLSPAEMRCILGHELAHLVRNDPAWHLLARVVEGVFFFQPLHRLAGRRLRRLSEYLCDDWTAERTGAPLELARCLTGVAERVLNRPRLFPVPGMAGSGSELERRVRRLLEGRDLRLRRAPVRGLVFGMITALLLVSWVAPGWSSDPPAEAEEEAATQTEPLAQEPPETAEVDARELDEVRAQLEEVRRQAQRIRSQELEEVRSQLEEVRKQAAEIRAHGMEEIREQLEEVRKQAAEIRAHGIEEIREQLEEVHKQAAEIRAHEMEEVRAQMEEARKHAEQIRDRELDAAREQMERARRQAEEEARRKQQERDQREAEESGDPEEESGDP
ncbi:MAG: hypothetical protein GY856_06730 [bacterium]|nr:hypothetical protein [bacterium]